MAQVKIQGALGVLDIKEYEVQRGDVSGYNTAFWAALHFPKCLRTPLRSHTRVRTWCWFNKVRKQGIVSNQLRSKLAQGQDTSRAVYLIIM